MMVLAELAREEGVFDFLAEVAVRWRGEFSGAIIFTGVRRGHDCDGADFE